MFGLDDKIASLGSGEAFLLVAVIAVLLGLRHATDPDHLTAVTTLIAGGSHHDHRKARSLGFVWGLGHATTLFAFGVPIVLAKNYLPGPIQQAAETAVGILIVGLAALLPLGGPGQLDLLRRGFGVGRDERVHPDERQRAVVLAVLV